MAKITNKEAMQRMAQAILNNQFHTAAQGEVFCQFCGADAHWDGRNYYLPNEYHKVGCAVPIAQQIYEDTVKGK